MRRLSLRMSAAVAATLLLSTGCAESRSALTGVPAATICTQQSVPVTLSDADPTAYNVVGWLCVAPDDGQGARTVQLLVSGLTFDHNYWDTSYQPDTYSYVRAATHHGYSTFNIDRLGVGRSDRPPADRLTLQAHAHSVSQIVAMLRAGNIGGTSFQKVVGVGHSLGAGILQYEAGTVTDPNLVPDFLILIGYLSKADPAVVAQIGANLYPAAQDPEFASSGLPAGYLTTKPGARHGLFFTDGDTDPAIVAVDEAVKTTSTLAERTTVGAARDPKVTHAVRVPVLMAVGQQDRLACADKLGLSCANPAALVAREAANFSASACLSAYVLPGAGHATNLHRNTQDAYAYGNDWLDKYTIDGAVKDANGCLG
jgi:pimeloyl-ACP methyl ester carboxylesterase